MNWKPLLPDSLQKALDDIHSLLETLPPKDVAPFRTKCEVSAGLSTDERNLSMAELTLQLAEYLTDRNSSLASQYFNLAGELFWLVSPKRLAAQLRRSVVGYFTVWIPSQASYTSAEDVEEEIKVVLKRLYGTPPTDLILTTNALVIDAYEHIRQSNGDDPDFLKSLLTENYKSIKELELPVDREGVRSAWREDCAHYAPHLCRILEAAQPEQPTLQSVLTEEVRRQVLKSIGDNSAEDVFRNLVGLREILNEMLRSQMRVPNQLSEPRRGLKLGAQGAEQPEFVEARRLLREGKKTAIQRFKELRRHNRTAFGQAIAQQWVAYALGILGDDADRIDARVSLRDIKQKDDTGDWNLACLHFLTNEPEDAFAVLESILEGGSHVPEVFEAALHLGLMLEKKEFLLKHLARSWYPEASLLGFFLAYEQNPSAEFEHSLVQIHRIVDDPSWVVPHPHEELAESPLTNLASDFSERRLLPAGVEWFRQRLTNRRHTFFFMNWKLLGDLLREFGQPREAFDAYKEALELTLRKPNLSVTIKKRAVVDLLYFCREAKLREEGLTILQRHSGDLAFTEAEREPWIKAFPRVISPPPPAQAPQSMSPTPIHDSERVAPPVRESEGDRATITQQRSTEETWKKLNEATNRISRMRTIGDYASQVTFLRQAIHALDTLFSSAFAGAKDNADQVMQVLETYQAAIDRDKKSALARGLATLVLNFRNSVEGVGSRELSTYAQPLTEAFERLRDQLVISTETLPEPQIEALARLNQFVPDDSTETAVLVRITNPSSEAMSKLNVTLTSLSSAIEILESGRYVEALTAKGRILLRFPIRRLEQNSVSDFRVTVSYWAAGTQHSVSKDSPIKTESFEAILGKERPYYIPERYVVSLPIAPDQVTNFHGREEDQRRILRSIEGGRLRKAIFINGIRRVGKTSLLASLVRVVPESIIPLLVDLRELDPGNRTNSVFLYHLARYIGTRLSQQLKNDFTPPTLDIFEAGPPDVVFVDYLNGLQVKLGDRRILLLLDEIQYVTKAVSDGRACSISETILNMLAAQCRPDGAFLLMFTASVRYAEIRRQCPHTLWGMVFPLDISFVSQQATFDILQRPVEQDKIAYPQEALQRAWEMTHGHPWITQAIGAEVLEICNTQRRLTASPEDIEDAVEQLIEVDTYASHWWNEQFLDALDREVAFVLLTEKRLLHHAVPMLHLHEALRKKALPATEQRVVKLCELEIFDLDKQNCVDIKGEFLAKWLEIELARTDAPRKLKQMGGDCAVLVDWDNVSIPLKTFVQSLPKEIKRVPYESRIQARHVAEKFLQNASKYGTPRQRWVVADWPKLGLTDIREFKEAGFHIDQGAGRKDPTDHVLKEKIRDVLEQFPEISTYVLVFGDGDYGVISRTLLERGKRVVVWSCTSALSGDYRRLPIEIEYIEDFLFADIKDEFRPSVAS